MLTNSENEFGLFDDILNKNPVEKKKIFIIKKLKVGKIWTNEEDMKLLNLADRHNSQNWKEIARGLGTRSAVQCCSRYKRISPGIIKGLWNETEDKLLLNLVNKFGRNWSLLSKYMPSRTGKQIRERFINSLDPEIKRNKFSRDEDKIILALYTKFGSSWSKIAECLKNRTADMIKNRFYSYLHKYIYGNGYKEKLKRKKNNLKGVTDKRMKNVKKVFRIDSLQEIENKFNGNSTRVKNRYTSIPYKSYLNPLTNNDNNHERRIYEENPEYMNYMTNNKADNLCDSQNFNNLIDNNLIIDEFYNIINRLKIDPEHFFPQFKKIFDHNNLNSSKNCNVDTKNNYDNFNCINRSHLLIFKEFLQKHLSSLNKLIMDSNLTAEYQNLENNLYSNNNSSK